LSQISTILTNKANQAYTLVTYVGPANFLTMDVAQSATSILDLMYQTSPSQIVPANFGSTIALDILLLLNNG